MFTFISVLLKTIAANIPGLYGIITRGTGGSDSARYCYSVWLRHLVMAHKSGLKTNPKIVAELGPGDSLGTGLAALLSGTDEYYALDTFEFSDNKKNIKIFEELIELFKKREKIPDKNEFPLITPHLDSYEFPAHILTDERINNALKIERIELIKNILSGQKSDDTIKISYFVPWHNPEVIKKESVDMIYSQAVLEHVDDLDFTYKTLYQWLKADGFMSHSIDFKSHGYAKKWNGHWGYSDFLWKLIRGRRPFLLNRQSHSKHIELMQKSGFKIISDIKNENHAGISRKKLASEFKSISDEDLVISEAFIQAVK